MYACFSFVRNKADDSKLNLVLRIGVDVAELSDITTTFLHEKSMRTLFIKRNNKEMRRKSQQQL